MTLRERINGAYGRAPSIESVIDRAIRIVSPAWAFERQAYRNAIEAASTQYVGAGRYTNRSDWNVVVGTPTAPIAELDMLRDRSRDANRNDGIAAAITNTMSMNIAGAGLQFQSRLRADRIGVSEDQAEILRQQIEDGWESWCKTADACDRLTFDDIQLLAVMKVIEDGDIIGIPAVKNSPWRKIQRVVEMVSSDRLRFATAKKNPDGSINDTGIETDSFGAPSSYSIRKTATSKEYTVVPARDADGRRQVIHLFRTSQPGQVRGVPMIAPIITLLKDFAGVMDATVMRARVAACLAVIFTRARPMASMLGASKGTTKETDPAKRIRELFPGMVEYIDQGDDVKMLDPAPDGGSFDPFVTTVLRVICASIGLPYELVVKDFSRCNYASVRAAILEGRRTFGNWRRWLGTNWNQQWFDLVLEEMVLSGVVKLPKYDVLRDEYSRGDWIGGGWGWVDPVKEIEASNMAIESGLSTLADECAASGKDYRSNLAQRRREIPEEQESGIVRTMPVRSTVGDNTENQRPSKQDARRAMILAESLKER